MEPVLLTTREVADLYQVHPETVARWVKKGYVTAVPTPGGRNRYPAHQFAHVRKPTSERNQ